MAIKRVWTASGERDRERREPCDVRRGRRAARLTVKLCLRRTATPEVAEARPARACIVGVSLARPPPPAIAAGSPARAAPALGDGRPQLRAGREHAGAEVLRPRGRRPPRPEKRVQMRRAVTPRRGLARTPTRPRAMRRCASRCRGAVMTPAACAQEHGGDALTRSRPSLEAILEARRAPRRPRRRPRRPWRRRAAEKAPRADGGGASTPCARACVQMRWRWPAREQTVASRKRRRRRRSAAVRWCRVAAASRRTRPRRARLGHLNRTMPRVGGGGTIGRPPERATARGRGRAADGASGRSARACA